MKNNYRFSSILLCISVLVLLPFRAASSASGEVVTLLDRPASLEGFTMRGMPDHGWWAVRSDLVPAEPRGVYRVSVEMETRFTAGNINVWVRQVRPDGVCISYARIVSLNEPVTLDFTGYSEVFVAADSAAQLQVYYLMRNVEGEATFRNLVLEKLTGDKARRVLEKLAVPPVYFSMPAYVCSDEEEISWGYRLNASLNPEAEKVSRIEMEYAAGDFRVDIEAAADVQAVHSARLKFNEGVHELVGRAYDAEGGLIAEETQELRSFRRPVRRDIVPVREVGIDGNNNLTVNGRPVFPMGMYHIWRRRDMVQLREQGFNVFEAWLPWTGDRGIGDFKRYMDWAAKEGLMAWTVIKVEDLDNTEIKYLVNTFREHPAHAFWSLIDEPSIRNWTPEMVRKKAKVVRETDARSPLFISFAREGRAVEYRDSIDIVAAHTYPLPFQEVGRVRDKMEALMSDFGHEMPVYATLQAWMNPNDPRRREHKPEEIRAMTYLAIIHGARGLNYYSFQSGTWRVVHHPRLWSVFKALTWEVESLSDVILTGDRGIGVRCSEPAIDYLGIEHGGAVYILAVNPLGSPLQASFAVEGWEDFRFTEKFRFGEADYFEEARDELPFAFSPLQTAVLKLTR